MALLEPLPIEVKTLAGDTRTYILSKFPCVEGREIVANYPLTAIPKASDYAANEAIMLKLMAYVAVDPKGNGNYLQLTTKVLVNNHIPDYETLVKLEMEMMKYNTSFFREGVASTFLSDMCRKALASVTPMLISSLPQLLDQVRQRLENSKNITH